MIPTPGDSWHHYLFKCICIVELSACSCAPLIEIYDQVHVPMMSQYKLQRIDLLYYSRESTVSVDFPLLHFCLSQCLILSISHILAKGVCVKYTPGNGSLLPPYCPRCLCWSFPCLVWADARWSFNFHERWYRWRCCAGPRGLRSSWQRIARWGGGSIAPQH